MNINTIFAGGKAFDEAIKESGGYKLGSEPYQIDLSLGYVPRNKRGENVEFHLFHARSYFYFALKNVMLAVAIIYCNGEA